MKKLVYIIRIDCGFKFFSGEIRDLKVVGKCVHFLSANVYEYFTILLCEKYFEAHDRQIKLSYCFFPDGIHIIDFEYTPSNSNGIYLLSRCFMLMKMSSNVYGISHLNFYCYLEESCCETIIAAEWLFLKTVGIMKNPTTMDAVY